MADIKQESLSSHIELRKYAYVGSTFDISVILTIVLLPSRSIHAEGLTYTLYAPSFVLIAQAIFLLEHGQIHPLTDAQGLQCN